MTVLSTTQLQENVCPVYTTYSFGNRVLDGQLKEVQIIEITTSGGGALSGSFDVSYQGHSVGLDVGASLVDLEVSLTRFVCTNSHSK